MSPPGPAQQVQPVACPDSSVNRATITVAPGAPPITGNTDYTGYGRRGENRVSQTDINNRMSALCARIKAAGITIYTVVLNTSGSVNAATQALYQSCASAPANFHLVSQPSGLRRAFQQIGQQLANLRLVR